MIVRRTRRSPSPSATRPADDGQILVIFAFGLVAMIAMVGLVLDGGSAFAQRRREQSVSDLATMAGATAYLNATGDIAARSLAAETATRSIATANGYTDGQDGVRLNVAVVPSVFAANVRLDLTRVHRNAFVGLLGMPTWDVSVSSTSVSSSRPNGARGAMPLIFNAEAFPNAVCDESAGPCVAEVYQEPGVGNQDVPQDATQFNWTIFCTANGNPCNGNSSGVSEIIDGNGTATTINLGMAIGPLNAGSHTSLFHAMGAYVGGSFPVPIVNDAGQMVGFAYFRLVSIEGASQKVVRGYFVSPINADNLVVLVDGPDAQINTGAFTIKLID